jgi:hypothetical protein
MSVGTGKGGSEASPPSPPSPSGPASATPELDVELLVELVVEPLDELLVEPLVEEVVEPLVEEVVEPLVEPLVEEVVPPLPLLLDDVVEPSSGAGSRVVVPQASARTGNDRAVARKTVRRFIGLLRAAAKSAKVDVRERIRFSRDYHDTVKVARTFQAGMVPGKRRTYRDSVVGRVEQSGSDELADELRHVAL